MSASARSDRLKFTARVTRRHGSIFAKIFIGDVRRTEVPLDAYELTDIVEWPNDPDDDSPANLRFCSIESEILLRVLDALEKPLRDAFVRIAGEVIERERRKDRKP